MQTCGPSHRHDALTPLPDAFADTFARIVARSSAAINVQRRSHNPPSANDISAYPAPFIVQRFVGLAEQNPFHPFANPSLGSIRVRSVVLGLRSPCSSKPRILPGHQTHFVSQTLFRLILTPLAARPPTCPASAVRATFRVYFKGDHCRPALVFQQPPEALGTSRDFLLSSQQTRPTSPCRKH